MKLRPYQEKMIADSRRAVPVFQRVLLQGPTGCGKTAITVFMMKTAAEKGKRSMFIVHQNELLKQTSRALWEQKLEHGLIASGKRMSNLPAQVASVQTLVRRLDKVNPPDLIIIDECHRSAAETYRKVLEAFPLAVVIGLTATPQRTDGKGLSDIYNTIVQGPSVRQLIKAGFLCRYEIFAPPSAVDMSNVKRSMGDYDKVELERALDKPTITGDAVATYKQHCTGRRCVVMCVSIKHAQHVTDSYNAAGVKAEMIEGTMTDAQRDGVLARVKSGETLVVCNVQLLIEGVDIPAIEVVQWLRPTESLIIWLQGNGRGFRPKPDGGSLTILDQVNNWKKHGLPDDDREWGLEGKKRKKKKDADDDEPELTIQQCKKCFHIFRAGVDTCPSCGAPVEVKTKAQIEVIEGELERINIEQERRDTRREQGSARGLRDLVELGYKRKMKQADKWAAICLASRSDRKPTGAEFSEARSILLELKLQ